MVLLAMLFMLEQRLQHRPDVATLLKSVLPRKDITEDVKTARSQAQKEAGLN